MNLNESLNQSVTLQWLVLVVAAAAAAAVVLQCLVLSWRVFVVLAKSVTGSASHLQYIAQSFIQPVTAVDEQLTYLLELSRPAQTIYLIMIECGCDCNGIVIHDTVIVVIVSLSGCLTRWVIGSINYPLCWLCEWCDHRMPQLVNQPLTSGDDYEYDIACHSIDNRTHLSRRVRSTSTQCISVAHWHCPVWANDLKQIRSQVTDSISLYSVQ